MGNVAGYLVLLILCTAAALLMNNVLGSMPLYVMVFMLFFSLGYTLCAQRRFRCTPGGGRRRFPRGVAAGVTARVENAGRLPLLHLRARVETGSDSSDLDFSLSPHEKKDLNLTVRLPHVGPYDIGVPQVRFFDPLGLFSLTRSTDTERVLSVPRVYELAVPAHPPDPLKGTSVSAFFAPAAEPDSYDGVREYRAGDPLRHIHWKLTAHTARYMSRRYETNRKEGVAVYIDRLRPAYPEEECRRVYDCVTEAGISIAAAAVRRNIATEVVSAGPNGFARHEVRREADMDGLAADLGARVFGGAAAMENLLAGERKSREGSPTLFICAAQISAGLVRSLSALAAAGRRPTLIYAVPDAGRRPEPEKKMLEYLARQGIPCETVDSAERLADPAGAGR